MPVGQQKHWCNPNCDRDVEKHIHFMKRIITAALAIWALAGNLQARLGETEAQSQARYGQAREDLTAETDKPLLPGAVEKCYE